MKRFSIVVALLLLAGCGESEAERQARLAREAACPTDLQCWGDKHSLRASFACDDVVERQATWSAEWTDGSLELKFSHFRWADREAGVLTFLGDRIRFQNGFGAWQNMAYECDWDPMSETVLAVRVRPGRL
jgi:hypothetical protein